MRQGHSLMAQTNQILRIYQLTNGYAYNSDSFFLVDFAKQWLKAKHTILDLGSGSGVVGLLCARHFGSAVSLLDINPLNAFLSNLNAQTNHIQAQIFHQDFLTSHATLSAIPTPKALQNAQSTHATQITQNPQTLQNPLITNTSNPFSSYPFDAFLTLHKSHKFDFIISNPPFYRTESVQSQNHLLAQSKNANSMPPEKWIPRTKRFLKPRGGIIFCYRPHDLESILSLLQEHKFNCETIRVVYPLLSREASLVLLFARLDSRTPLRILPPLITHNSSIQTDFSDEVKFIYATYRTHSIKVHSEDIVLPEALDIF